MYILIEKISDDTIIFGNIIQFLNKIFVPTVKPHIAKNSDFKFLEK